MRIASCAPARPSDSMYGAGTPTPAWTQPFTRPALIGYAGTAMSGRRKGISNRGRGFPGPGRLSNLASHLRKQVRP